MLPGEARQTNRFVTLVGGDFAEILYRVLNVAQRAEILLIRPVCAAEARAVARHFANRHFADDLFAENALRKLHHVALRGEQPGVSHDFGIQLRRLRVMRDARLRVGAQHVFPLLNAVFAPAGDAVHSAFFRHMQKRFRHFQRTQDAAVQFRAVFALRRAFNHVPDDHGVDVGIRTPADFPRLHRPELLFRGFGRFLRVDALRRRQADFKPQHLFHRNVRQMLILRRVVRHRAG